MAKQKIRFRYGIIFLFILVIFSIFKSLYIKSNNDNKDIPVYKENQPND